MAGFEPSFSGIRTETVYPSAIGSLGQEALAFFKTFNVALKDKQFQVKTLYFDDI